MRIYKIALTGGPCGGKTDVFNFLIKRLKELKYNVITVPETAREFIENGIPPHGDNEYVIKFQNAILNRQLQKEKDAYNFSIDNDTYIILCDRGIMDGQAYINDKKDFDMLLNNHNLNELSAIQQYDLIIDLISLASYVPELYVQDEARDEEPETAMEKDYNATKAWLLHPNIKVVYPTNTIEEKYDIVLNIILNTIQPTQEKTNKTITYEIDLENSNLSIYTVENSKFINVTEKYLDTGICDIKYVLSDREYKGCHSYNLKVIRGNGSNLKLYDQKTITEKEYEQFFNWYEHYKIVHSKQIVFINDLQIYKINLYDNNATLEFENINNTKGINIPDNIVIKNKHEKTLVKK